MTVETLPAPTTDDTGDDDDLWHIYHLCDPDRALCGVDLTGVPEVDEPGWERQCVVCVLAWEMGVCCSVG